MRSRALMRSPRRCEPKDVEPSLGPSQGGSTARSTRPSRPCSDVPSSTTCEDPCRRRGECQHDPLAIAQVRLNVIVSNTLGTHYAAAPPATVPLLQAN